MFILVYFQEFPRNHKNSVVTRIYSEWYHFDVKNGSQKGLPVSITWLHVGY